MTITHHTLNLTVQRPPDMFKLVQLDVTVQGHDPPHRPNCPSPCHLVVTEARTVGKRWYTSYWDAFLHFYSIYTPSRNIVLLPLMVYSDRA